MASLTVAAFLIVVGATAANAATGSVMVTSASVGRNASFDLTYDVTVVAEDVQGPGRICSSSQYTCTVRLDAQFEDGSFRNLPYETIPWGATFPYAKTLSGIIDGSKVIAVRAILQGNNGGFYSGWFPVNDPGLPSEVSISVGSIGRSASNLTFDVTATVSKVQGSGRICSASQYTCTLSLIAQSVEGDAVRLQNVTIPWGATFPFTHEFVGTFDTSKVIAVEAYVSGDRGTVSSGWSPVTDTDPTSTVAVAAISIGRDSASKLTFDATVTATAVQGNGRICFTSTCNVTLYAQRADGAAFQLQSAAIPWGAAFPYVKAFAGTIDVSKVIAVRAEVRGAQRSIYSGWTAVKDPLTTATGAGSVAVSAATVSRTLAGNLAYNVSASVTGASLPDGPCKGSPYSCDLVLQIRTESGDISGISSSHVPLQANYTTNFVGTWSSVRITAIRVYTVTYGTPTLYTPWVAVTDPGLTPPDPSATSVAVSPVAIGRDASTGKLTYDVSATVLGASLPYGACGGDAYNCSLYLQTLSASGDIGNLTYSALPLQASYTKNFVGSASRSKITAIRVRTVGNANLTSTYSPWVAVTDPYPDRSVAVTSSSISRDASTGNLTYGVSATVSGASLPDGPCAGTASSCNLNVQTLSASGDISTLTSSAVSVTQVRFAKNFVGSTARGKIIAIRAYTSSYYNLTSYYSPWIKVHDRDKSESAGGGNAAQKGCECSAADPVNTQTGEFYETAADLGVPGVGPAVAVSRTYSTLSAAVNGPFGYGTTSNFNSSLVIDTPGDSTDPLPKQVHIVQENGATVPFTKASDGTYPADPWVLATLTRDASSGNWTFTRDKKQVFVFNSSGALVSTSDLHGNTISYGYTSGHVTSITGSGGREVYLFWALGRVSAIQDSAGRSVTYGYDSSGNLATVTAADGGISRFTYDSSHRVLTMKKPGGGVTTNVYNSTGQVITQTDPVGRVTSFPYSGATTTVTLPGGSVTSYTFNQGQPAAITTATGTPLASTTTFAYDTEGNKVSETDPLGHVTAYTYDSAGNPLTVTDPLGRVTTNTFDALGDVLSVEDALGRTTEMTYNSVGDMTSLTSPGGHVQGWTLNSDGTVASHTDARGKTTTTTYNAAGWPLCTTDPESRQTCTAYDARGLVTTATNGAGAETTYTYDDLGRVLTNTDPNDAVTTTTYDGDGNKVSVEDPNGNVTSFAYDAAGQLLTSTDALNAVTSYTYTARGEVASVTNPNGDTVTKTYDALNRVATVTDGEGRTTSYAYDLAGHLLSTTLPSGAVASSTYDAAGQVVTTTDALGKVTSFSYDAAGQVTGATDPLARTTTSTYTADGLVDTVTYPDTSTEQHAYNANGQETAFTNADGGVSSYTYSDAGLLLSKTEPGSLVTSYTYDSAKRLHTVTTPDSHVSTRSYDAAGYLIGINYPGTADDVTYSYDANGQRIVMIDATGTTSYTYTAVGQVASVQDGAGQSLGYGYDPAGQLTTITYPGNHTVTYGYDNAAQMTSVTGWATGTTTFGHNLDGDLTSRVDPNGVTETRGYDAAGRVTNISDDTSAATVADYSYGYDAAGQLTSSTLADALHAATTHSWGYDPRGQLTTTAPSAGYTSSPAGLVHTTPAGDTLSYNTANQLTGMTNTGTGVASSYSYDANGARTDEVTTPASGPAVTKSFDYTETGALNVFNGGGTTVSYESDGDGLRHTRTVGATSDNFLWDPTAAIPLLLSDGVHSYVYGPGLTPIAQIDTTGTVEYLYGDNLGSVRTVTNDAGSVVSSTDYDPYGNVTTHAGTSDSQIGYTGAWTDPTSGLVYLRARDYDPGTHQFLTVDPALTATHQPYAYVGNNPLGATDPTGLCVLTDMGPYDCKSRQELDATLKAQAAARENTVRDVFTSPANQKMWREAQQGFNDGASLGITEMFRSQQEQCALDSSGIYQTERILGTIIMSAATFGAGAEVSAAIRGSTALTKSFQGINTVTKATTAASDAADLARGLSYSTKIEGQLAGRGWTKEAIQATVESPNATHAVWDLTTGAKQAATAYVQRSGGYVVVNEESGAVVQISNLNKAGWKPVWEDPRFMR
ncbi:MAG TPA: RHS repeat-associated core domain-containing protein [Pseudolysinimonas sp.]|nr:RHS repeat-associated core domain-containing protein [Pseudolysinimonas sp.]